MQQAVELATGESIGNICERAYYCTIISNAIGLKECAIAGMVIALLPQWLIEREIEAGKLIEILPNYEVTATVFDTSAWLVYPSRTYLPLRIKVFIDFLKQHLADG